MTRLAEMFNVNHFIVSQVNPHVVPFLAREEEIVGAEAQQNPAVTARSTWIHNLANLAKGEALHRLHVLSELGVFPNYVGKVRSVLHQRYSGDITILPTITYAQFPRVLSNPTTEYMLNCLLTGERATWPKLSRIQNHLAIELALDETVRQLRTRVVFSPSQIDLRLNNLNRPLSQGNMPFPKLPSKHGVTRSDTAPPTPLTTASPPGSLRQATQSRNRVLSDAQKQYLPTYPWQRNLRTTVANHNTSLDAFSSSNTYGSSEDDALSDESNTSAVLSAPSPPHSPSSVWPSACQLFNSSSRPFTASLLDSVDPSATLTDRDMKPNDNTEVASPSSPELRYKPFFHPPSLSAEAPAAPVAAGLGLDIDMTTQPLEFNLSPRRTMTLPES
jgi:TAG lipase/steryl ester hydrolase/phospholipase A2/LPA acyltransferase